MTTKQNQQISYHTLADLRRDTYHRLWAHCERCFRIEELDLESVIDILGGDFRTLQLHWKLRCTVCDKDKPPIRLIPGRDKPLCRYFHGSRHGRPEMDMSETEKNNGRASQGG